MFLLATGVAGGAVVPGTELRAGIPSLLKIPAARTQTAWRRRKQSDLLECRGVKREEEDKTCWDGQRQAGVGAGVVEFKQNWKDRDRREQEKW